MTAAAVLLPSINIISRPRTTTCPSLTGRLADNRLAGRGATGWHRRRVCHRLIKILIVGGMVIVMLNEAIRHHMACLLKWGPWWHLASVQVSAEIQSNKQHQQSSSMEGKWNQVCLLLCCCCCLILTTKAQAAAAFWGTTRRRPRRPFQLEGCFWSP